MFNENFTNAIASINDQFKAIAALADGLSVHAEDLAAVASYYTEHKTPLFDDSSLFTDAQSEANRYFKPDPTGVATANTAKYWEISNKKSMPTDLEAMLMEETLIDNNLTNPNKEELSSFRSQMSCEKINYAIKRAKRANYFNEEDIKTYKNILPKAPEPTILQNKSSLVLSWNTGASEIIALQIRNYGEERVIRAYKKLLDEWHQVTSLSGIEFPIAERGTKDEHGKYKFKTMPVVPQLISFMSSNKHRTIMAEAYEWFDEYKTNYLKELDAERTTPYIETDIESDSNKVSFMEKDFCEVEEMIRNGQDEFRPGDTEWSWDKWNEFVAECVPAIGEPHDGLVVRPCKSRKHKSVKQTLRWITGGWKRDKTGNKIRFAKGFMSHSSLCREVRYLFQNIAEATWKYLNDKEQSIQQSIPQKSEYTQSIENVLVNTVPQESQQLLVSIL